MSASVAEELARRLRSIRCRLGMHSYAPYDQLNARVQHIFDTCKRCGVMRGYVLFWGTAAWMRQNREALESYLREGHKTGYRIGQILLVRRYRLWCCPVCYTPLGPGQELHTRGVCDRIWALRKRHDTAAPKIWNGVKAGEG